MKKKVPTPVDTTHARLAPSAMKGYEVCPSYLPSHGSTKASERGTALHGLLEEHEDAAHEHAETAEDLDSLEKIANYITPFLATAKKLKREVLKEYRFDLLPLDVDGCDGGTADLLILHEPTMEIDLFDYKMGWWEVEDAETNIQLWLYVLGCFFNFKWCRRVKVHILQPGRDEISTATFTDEDVTRMLLRARTIADRTNRLAGKAFNVVVDNCLWCANKANCKALHEIALNAAYQANLQLPNVNLVVDDFNDLENAGDVYDVADLIAKWAQAMKWKITQMAVDGEDVPGHRLTEVKGKRIVVDPEGAYEVLRDNFQVDLSEFLAASNPSVTKMLKCVSDHAEHGNKAKQAVAASEALMGAGVLTQSSPSAYLTRIKSK